jgi:hypothetical protein
MTCRTSCLGSRIGPAVGYLLLAASHTFVCRTWDDLAARLVWARLEGYRTAKARRVNWYEDRPLLPSEYAALVKEAKQLALVSPSGSKLRCPNVDAANLG